MISATARAQAGLEAQWAREAAAWQAWRRKQAEAAAARQNALPANLPPEAQQAYWHGVHEAQAWIEAHAAQLRAQKAAGHLQNTKPNSRNGGGPNPWSKVDPETVDMSEIERLKAYQQTPEYQARHKQTLVYDLEHRYQVTLSGTIPWSYDSVIVISNAVGRMSQKLGGPDVFAKAVGPVQIQINSQISSGGLTHDSGKIEFQQSTLTHQQPRWLGEVAVVHELAHAWAFNQSPVFRILGIDNLEIFCHFL